MTEVQRVGELGLVRGAASEPGEPRVLHLVPHTFSAPDFKYHGSTKDFADRQQYFQDRGLAFDTFHHRKNADLLSTKMKPLELPDYTHVVVDGTFTLKDWKYVRERWPAAKLIYRTHNNELPHRKDTQLALWRAAPTDDVERREQDIIDAKMNRRVFLDRDLAAAKYADCVLSIENLKPAARYWSWLGFRGELLAAPYFLTDEYLTEIAAKVEAKSRARKDWVICVMSSHPGALTYDSLMAFHQAVSSLGERKQDWRFRATGRQFWIKNSEVYSLRVKPIGIVDDLMDLLAQSRAVAVLSELGRGFKTKILEAILCGDWVLVNPALFARLPEAVKPYCVVVDLDSPFGFDEALDRIKRKEWPGGDPNAEMREAAYAAMDCAFFGDRRAGLEGATLSQDPNAKQKSKVEYWRDSEPGRVEVTMCTVLTPLHKRVAGHNYELTALLNPGCKIRWNVVDNNDVHMNDKRTKAFLHQLAKTRGKVHPDQRAVYMQSAKAEYFDHGDIEDYIPGAKVIPGMSLDETFDYFYAALNATPEQETEYRHFLSKFLASYHHAGGLNLALDHVRTRYAVVIDPDLYVVRPDWIRQIVDHMAKNDLAVFGVPWNPRWYQKFRYFPCTHLMVIDLQKYRWRKDLLAPDLVRPKGKYISLFWKDYPEARQKGKWSAIRHLLRNLPTAIREDFKQRGTVGRSRDTGYSMLEDFRTRPELKAEVATAVFTPELGFQPETVTAIQLALDAIMPDGLAYLPKRRGAWTTSGFKERGYPDTRQWAWEEFVWKDDAFAFHVRGELHRKPIGRADDVQVLNVLNTILRRLGRPPLPDRAIGGSNLTSTTDITSWKHMDEAVAQSEETAPTSA